MPNSFEIVVRAGATIEDETGDMNVKDDTTIVAAHFLPKLQFFGFSGSSGPSHETCLKSVNNMEIANRYWRDSYQIGIFDGSGSFLFLQLWVNISRLVNTGS